MTRNPWCFVSIKFVYPSKVVITLKKRDIRGGFDLGRFKEKEFVVIDLIDFHRTDKNYWKRVFKRIMCAGEEWNIDIPQECANVVIQKIRNYRYNYKRPRFKEWEERYGREVARWAMCIIEDEVDDPCKDNFRLARAGDKRALRRYNRAKERGCCGSFDVVRYCIYDGFYYHVGCNYGH
jgi:hypothetical protein